MPLTERHINIVLALAVLGLTAANVSIAVASWPDYNVFGYFAWAWVLMVVVALALRYFFGLPVRWSRITALAAVATGGFLINAHYLAELTGSV